MSLSVNEARKHHRASIVNLSLTEILILMVFSVMAYTILSIESGATPSTELAKELEETKKDRDKIRDDYNKAITDLYEQQKKTESLLKVLQSKERLLSRLLQSQEGTLSVGQKKLHEELQNHIKDLEKQVANERRMITEKQQYITRLLKEGKGRTGYPICAITSGFLLEIELNSDGSLLVKPAWSEGAEADARDIPGVTQLIHGQSISIDNFSEHASQIYTWGDQQTIPCRFSIRTVRKSEDLTTYLSQIKTVEKYFYAKKDY
ncbi:MAG: hypothetical protein OEZ39_06210 [Gammaproteobacteria bacterium]|nr:hypothetical protein [Gammaproteobacteria bacterium]MDH5651449.1 hypothetical protein [Gammaproteobacteria bacterium]